MHSICISSSAWQYGFTYCHTACYQKLLLEWDTQRSSGHPYCVSQTGLHAQKRGSTASSKARKVVDPHHGSSNSMQLLR
jgi:hypothetical protein